LASQAIIFTLSTDVTSLSVLKDAFSKMNIQTLSQNLYV
jgi:hypothetical protein